MTREVLPEGTVLKERYVIDELMGIGGFANAYRAWDPVLNCFVAIKEYRENVTGFLEEARITAQFRSCPNVVYIYDFFEEKKAAYIVMEFLKGQTLKRRLNESGKIGIAEALIITYAILNALDTIQKSGMVHRDVAPDNVFLLENGKIKLFDFGCAGRVGEAQRSAVVKNGYSPPEQYRSGCLQKPSADVYAAAAVLVHMLSGKKPQPAPEREVRDCIPQVLRSCTGSRKNLRKVLARALRKDPGKRIQTAEEFAEELRRCGRNTPLLLPAVLTVCVCILLTAFFRRTETEYASAESSQETETVPVIPKVSAGETEGQTERSKEASEETAPVTVAETETISEHETATEPETVTETETQTETEQETETETKKRSNEALKETVMPETVYSEPTVPDPAGW